MRFRRETRRFLSNHGCGSGRRGGGGSTAPAAGIVQNKRRRRRRRRHFWYWFGVLVVTIGVLVVTIAIVWNERAPLFGGNCRGMGRAAAAAAHGVRADGVVVVRRGRRRSDRNSRGDFGIRSISIRRNRAFGMVGGATAAVVAAAVEADCGGRVMMCRVGLGAIGKVRGVAVATLRMPRIGHSDRVFFLFV